MHKSGNLDKSIREDDKPFLDVERLFVDFLFAEKNLGHFKESGYTETQTIHAAANYALQQGLPQEMAKKVALIVQSIISQ